MSGGSWPRPPSAQPSCGRRTGGASQVAPEAWLGENPDAWGFVLPAVVIILGLSVVPMVWSFLLSLSVRRPRHARRAGSGWRTTARSPRTRTSGRRRPHARVHGLFVPLSIAGGLGLALMLNRKIRLHRRLPHPGLRAVRHLRDGPGRAVLVHLRPAVRDRERRPGLVRHPAAGVLRRQQPGTAAPGADRPLERSRVLRRGLSRRPAGHPAGADRGGGDRRRARWGTFGTSSGRPSSPSRSSS